MSDTAFNSGLYGLEGRLTLDQVIHRQTVVTRDMGTIRINLG